MNYLPGLRASLVRAARERHAQQTQTPRAVQRRRLPSAAIAAAISAAVAAAVAVVAIVALAHRQAQPRSVSSSAGTQLAVHRDAARTLRRVALPPGARLSRLVRGTPIQLWSPSDRLAIPGRVDVYRIWRLPQAPDRVIAFIEAHLPGGGSSFGMSSEAGSSGPGGPVKVQAATTAISFPATSNGIWRELAVNAVALNSGGTALRIDSEAGWLAPRPVDERIPRRVTRVAVQWSRPGTSRHGSSRITSPGRVRAALALFNALPLARPAVRACNGASGAILSFAFEAQGSSTPLAVARWVPGCDTVSLTVAGRPAIKLMAGYPTSPPGAQIVELVARVPTVTAVTSVRAGATTVNSQTCVTPKKSAPSPLAPGVAGGSCASVRSSTTTASPR